MLTVRLPEELEKELEGLSRQLKVTKTEIVKAALTEYIRKFGRNPYEAGKDLFGCDNSNISGGSTEYKESFRRHIHEKHSY